MKLLFDANLSSKLVERLSDVFPGSTHVSALGLERALDRELLDRAAEAGFIVVSKDEDLHQLVLLHGPPPKVVWVRLGNCTTPEAEAALRGGVERIASLAADEDAAFLVLGPPSD